MSTNTIEANRRAGAFADHDELWLFGYGSLIYKAGFDYIERRPVRITGWARRFWQGSHDHRGTPGAPGRVVTLVAAPGETCTGMAYRVTPAVFDYLDHREKNGYLRAVQPMTFEDGHVEDGLAYIATADNAAWLGEASIDDIAEHIRTASGPSGPNRDYALHLADALRDMNVADTHCLAVADRLRALIAAE
ncbi:gamma-glutamylcyclotransferase [Salinisphaera sp. Q1T1-3]|uniref:gamma-glutamylcyclotransferase n=1 Tax=Salinisphaera sp. Q1T1-3 TaxID=2321229 RepID=UPI000E751417|nr:gamma-glutamylcyclotransferase [Salinisphaera sp. Q1T1-3]RJS91037.1 gamma-glutamylcyclotransferase [Salinisphaera sp. Q1T1-3]